jgi:hypothetical protein
MDIRNREEAHPNNGIVVILPSPFSQALVSAHHTPRVINPGYFTAGYSTMLSGNAVRSAHPNFRLRHVTTIASRVLAQSFQRIPRKVLIVAGRYALDAPSRFERAVTVPKRRQARRRNRAVAPRHRSY